MADSWPSATLQEVCSTITDGAHLSPPEDPLGRPMASVKDLTRHGIDLSNCKRISAKDFEVLKRQGCMPQWGDVLIAKDGNSALDTVCVHRLQEEVVLLSSVAILRPSEKIDSDYLRYYLDAPQTRALLKSGFRSGSAIPRVVLRDFRRAPITVPPLAEQRAIAHILGRLDDKIQLNRRMSATLEEIARALFKSWFVDFDPVRAKAERLAPGLPTALADFFPDSFEDSELDEIPKGWEVRGLDEIGRFLNGLALQKYPATDGESLPVIKIAQLRAGQTSGADRANLDVPTDYIVDDGDVLFSWSGSLEVVLWVGGRGALNQHIFKVTSESFPRWFFYLWIAHHLAGFRHIAAAKATTMGHIQRHHLSEAKVVVPPRALLDAASQHLRPLIDASVKVRVQSKTLNLLRDELHPRLISGELRVADAVAVAGATE